MKQETLVKSQGRYAKKFVNGDISLYIVKGQNQYSTICFMAGSMISSTKYDTIYSLLADSNVISDQNLHNAISMEFMSEMKSEVNITTVQKSILRKIIDERQKYEDLLEKINNEETDLQNVVDPNPEKIKSLSDIKKRVTENLAKVNDEISKITK
jgi:vacuolar-type H+-ATPase subunit I/STV1